MTIVRAGTLIDGTGATPVRDASIILHDGRIEAITTGGGAPGARDEVIDASGMTVLPGLIDGHDHLAFHGYDLAGRWGLDERSSTKHLRTARAIEQTLAMGYTAVRDAGGLDAGFGADVIKCATTGGASSRAGHGPRDQAFDPDEMKALCDEAHALGRKVMCHALGGAGLRIALEAGADSIEHGCRERARALREHHVESIRRAMAKGVKVVAGTDAGGHGHPPNAAELRHLVEAGLTPMQAIQAATGVEVRR
ncbi:MAG TPA: amidohydrolase family protein [Candidatus Limnocylindria bacterium]|nr:amidohydrolase family protein [Candidatus Limnocylindria bacterium]